MILLKNVDRKCLNFYYFNLATLKIISILKAIKNFNQFKSQVIKLKQGVLLQLRKATKIFKNPEIFSNKFLRIQTQNS